jgi:hypothetical protein
MGEKIFRRTFFSGKTEEHRCQAGRNSSVV